MFMCVFKVIDKTPALILKGTFSLCETNSQTLKVSRYNESSFGSILEQCNNEEDFLGTRAFKINARMS